jgi:hypothetical protein
MAETVRDPQDLPGPGQALTLDGGVVIAGHPALRAKARLAPAPLGKHDLEAARLPQPLFDAPCLSVLELTDVADPSVVTAQAPLRVSLPTAIEPGEHVIPVAYDGEFLLPLGRVESRNRTTTGIALDRLPSPHALTRSLGGAIKIYFQKVISRVLRTDFPYPILGVADVAGDGTVSTVADPIQVRQRVAGAQRILLFIHGIIGDTASMVPSVQLAKLADGRPLAALYDLILTFDYENLNTTIEDNGRLLGERLAAAGLGPGHGKLLDSAAHSMGGLVSRWFIERAGGDQVVRRLVMLGTPNGGSPWPSVVDWALMALGFGLNHLTTIPWPASVLGSLAGVLEKPTVSLQEMLPTAPVLVELNQSADPKIPYVMLAGNTSLIPAATVSEGAGGSLLSRLLARLTSPEFLHDAADPFFLDRANDIAVLVTSMENVAAGRTPVLDVRLVACDHLSYFTVQAGLKGLAGVLAEGA